MEESLRESTPVGTGGQEGLTVWGFRGIGLRGSLGGPLRLGGVLCDFISLYLVDRAPLPWLGELVCGGPRGRKSQPVSG